MARKTVSFSYPWQAKNDHDRNSAESPDSVSNYRLESSVHRYTPTVLSTIRPLPYFARNEYIRKNI